MRYALDLPNMGLFADARLLAELARDAEQAGWDKEILAIELQGLIDLNFEVELTGFATAEIDLILDEAAEANPSSGTKQGKPIHSGYRNRQDERLNKAQERAEILRRYARGRWSQPKR